MSRRSRSRILGKRHGWEQRRREEDLRRLATALPPRAHTEPASEGSPDSTRVGDSGPEDPTE